MILTTDIYFKSYYTDGAGNTGTYSYRLGPTAGRVITIYDLDIWQLHIFNEGFPPSGLTLTAFALTTITGSPPAYGGRTCTVSVTGVVAFTGANPTYESLYNSMVNITVTDVPEHSYEVWDLIGHFGSPGRWAKIQVWCNSALQSEVTTPAEDVIAEDVVGSYTEGATIGFQFFPCSTDITNKQLRLFSYSIVEGNLLSRAYDGRYIELGLKAVIALARAKNNQTSLLKYGVLEVAGYLQGDGPLDMYIPQQVHTVRMGS